MQGCHIIKLQYQNIQRALQAFYNLKNINNEGGSGGDWGGGGVNKELKLLYNLK